MSNKKHAALAKAVNTVRVVIDRVTTLAVGPAIQINCMQAPEPCFLNKQFFY
jgi:hypothetical protein